MSKIISCRHCGHYKVNRPRGLCWKCYYTPGVRNRYESTSKFARRPKTDATTKESQPTDTLPGTKERVEVMAKRYERGEHIFNENDAKGTP